MFAYHRPRGYGDDGERLALGAFDGPRFACAKDAGDYLVLGNPDWGVTKAEREEYHERLKTLGLGLEDRMTAKVGSS